MTEKVKEEIGYAWNFIADLGNSRQFSISGNFPKGMELADMNKEVDNIRTVFDRQQAKSASRAAGEEIEQLILRKDAAIEDLAMLDEKLANKNGGPNATERQQREAAVVCVGRMAQDIEFKEKVHKELLDEAK